MPFDFTSPSCMVPPPLPTLTEMPEEDDDTTSKSPEYHRQPRIYRGDSDNRVLKHGVGEEGGCGSDERSSWQQQRAEAEAPVYPSLNSPPDVNLRYTTLNPPPNAYQFSALYPNAQNRPTGYLGRYMSLPQGTYRHEPHYPSLQSYPQLPPSSVFPPYAYQNLPLPSVYPYPPSHANSSKDGGTWWYIPSPAQHGPAARPLVYYPQPGSPQSQYSPDSSSESPISERSSFLASVSSSPPASPVHQHKRRKEYPEPLAVQRSDWAMWVGNMPKDAMHDEVWSFFTQSDSPSYPDFSTNGVVSIFLIVRSSCAFVNYETEHALNAAISRFNGVRMRLDNSRCLPLVCRIRHKEDDLRSGVGGQRVRGMHRKWVKEKLKAAPEAEATAGKQGKAKADSGLSFECGTSVSTHTKDREVVAPGPLSLQRSQTALSRQIPVC